MFDNEQKSLDAKSGKYRNYESNLFIFANHFHYPVTRCIILVQKPFFFFTWSRFCRNFLHPLHQLHHVTVAFDRRTFPRTLMKKIFMRIKNTSNLTLSTDCFTALGEVWGIQVSSSVACQHSLFHFTETVPHSIALRIIDMVFWIQCEQTRLPSCTMKLTRAIYTFMCQLSASLYELPKLFRGLSLYFWESPLRQPHQPHVQQLLR